MEDVFLSSSLFQVIKKATQLKKEMHKCVRKFPTSLKQLTAVYQAIFSGEMWVLLQCYILSCSNTFPTIMTVGNQGSWIRT